MSSRGVRALLAACVAAGVVALGFGGAVQPSSAPAQVGARSVEPASIGAVRGLALGEAERSGDPQSAVTSARVSAPVAASPASVSLAPVAAFLGDSYTSGYVGAGLGPNGWAAIVSRSLGLRTVNAAVPGTGFVNPGWTRQPVSTRISTVVAARPRVLFVAAGHNDRRFGAAASARAAAADLARLRSLLPNTLIVVVGPIWQDGRPPVSLLALRDDLRRLASGIGAAFIDPLRTPWFGGTWHRLIGPDGIHPTDAGHRHIAAQVLAALRSNARFVARLASLAA